VTTFDKRKNFAISTVTTAPSPASSGTSLSVADGSLFPTVPFNAIVFPATASPLITNAEIIRVTAVSTNDFTTIVRQQEGTSARTIIVGDRIMVGITDKVLTDIENAIGGSDGVFINNLVNGTLSSELFTLPHGVNEFSLLYENGYYHWFYTTYEVGDFRVHHRAALTIAGLASATDTEILPATNVCPTALLVGSTWNLWVTNSADGGRTVHHYTASNPNGAYSWHDDLTGDAGDPSVRKWDLDGKYYMGYIGDGANWRIGLKQASSPNGPWTDLGFIFSVLGKESWYTLESDPCVFFMGSRCFVSFAGWDGVSTQKCGLVEVNTSTWKAFAAGTVIQEPTETWMQRNATRIFNPVWLEHDGLYYFSQNPYNGGYAPSVATGWGYKQPAHPSLSVLDTATVNLTLAGQLITADVIPGGIDASDLASGVAPDGSVLTADGLGNSAWGSASSGEVLMADGITPPDPLLLEDSTDWLYSG
jgi:hypothetical protein